MDVVTFMYYSEYGLRRNKFLSELWSTTENGQSSADAQDLEHNRRDRKYDARFEAATASRLCRRGWRTDRIVRAFSFHHAGGSQVFQVATAL